MEKDFLVEKEIRPRGNFLSLIFSLIPGAGHMYLGLMGKGIVIMASFFFVGFIMGWLNLSLLAFMLPVIWFYGFFDSINTRGASVGYDIDISKLLKLNISFDLGSKAGYILIIIGLLILSQKMIMPLVYSYLDYRIINYLQTILLSLIFIAGGLYIIRKNKGEENHEED